MFNKGNLKRYSGRNEELNFEHFLLKFAALCVAEEWKESSWGNRLKYYLDGDIKKKYEKIIKYSSDYKGIVKDLRKYMYGNDYIAINYNQLQDAEQKEDQTLLEWALFVKTQSDKAYVFVTDDDQRDRLAVLAFFRGLCPNLKKCVDENIENSTVSNIEEAVVAVLVSLKSKK